MKDWLFSQSLASLAPKLCSRHRERTPPLCLHHQAHAPLRLHPCRWLRLPVPPPVALSCTHAACAGLHFRRPCSPSPPGLHYRRSRSGTPRQPPTPPPLPAPSPDNPQRSSYHGAISARPPEINAATTSSELVPRPPPPSTTVVTLPSTNHPLDGHGRGAGTETWIRHAPIVQCNVSMR